MSLSHIGTTFAGTLNWHRLADASRTLSCIPRCSAAPSSY